MKKQILILSFGLLGFVKIRSQIPCNLPTTPTTQDLLNALNQKPVKNIKPLFYIENCNVNDSVKERLLYRLQHWEWSKEEIDTYYKKEIEYHKDFYQIEKKAAVISKGNDSVYKKALDSIIMVTNKYTLKEMQNSHLFSVDGNTILIVGWLKMKEAIPFLKNVALKDSGHYPKWYVEITLARMGDKKLQKKFIEDDKKIKPWLITEKFNKVYEKSYKSMIFLGTQESIYELHKWIDTSLINQVDSKGGLGRLSGLLLWDISKAILNKDFKLLVSQVDTDEFSNGAALLSVKNWILQNKGKYEINRKFCPY